MGSWSNQSGAARESGPGCWRPRWNSYLRRVCPRSVWRSTPRTRRRYACIRPSASRRSPPTDTCGWCQRRPEQRSPRALANASQASEGRSRWGSDPIGILSGKPAARQLETHALLALAHRPAMVGAEHGPHQPCEAAEQRLFGADPPVVVSVDVVAVLHEGPHATTDEIPVGTQGDPTGSVIAHDREAPAQRVGKPALGPEVHDATDAVGVALIDHLHIEVHRRPPARQVPGIAEDGGNLVRGRPQPPSREEVILVAHQEGGGTGDGGGSGVGVEGSGGGGTGRHVYLSQSPLRWSW